MFLRLGLCPRPHWGSSQHSPDHLARLVGHFLVSEWVSVYGLTCHLTHNRSLWRRVFADNQFHWYWQPKTIKHNTTYTRNTKEKQKKTALANKTIYTLIWYAFYDLRSGNGVDKKRNIVKEKGCTLHVASFTLSPLAYLNCHKAFNHSNA